MRVRERAALHRDVRGRTRALEVRDGHRKAPSRTPAAHVVEGANAVGELRWQQLVPLPQLSIRWGRHPTTSRSASRRFEWLQRHRNSDAQPRQSRVAFALRTRTSRALQRPDISRPSARQTALRVPRSTERDPGSIPMASLSFRVASPGPHTRLVMCLRGVLGAWDVGPFDRGARGHVSGAKRGHARSK